MQKRARISTSMSQTVALAVAIGACAPVSSAEEPPAAPPLAVADHMNVGMEYTLTVDGQVVDSTEGKELFHYVQGGGQILEALEAQLAGLHVGDTKEVTLTSAQGYGEIDPEAFVEVTKDRLPEDLTPEPGMILQGVNPETQKSFRARIHEIKGDNVVLDLNHPLAGKPLNFKVTIKEIAPAQATAPAAAPAAADAPQPS